MSIVWQTGEPPEKTDLLIRMRWPSVKEEYTYLADKCDDVWYVDGMEAKGIEVLAWSTLNAAPDMIGRLEALARTCKSDKHIEIGGDETRIVIGVYRIADGLPLAEAVEAPTLAAAIEQLCEKQ